MTFAHPDSLDHRVSTLERLNRRNWLVAVLRVAVPGAGVLAFVFLAAQIYIANTLHQYGVSGIRVDRGNLVVETPQYTGTGGDGSRYVVKAREARTPIDNPALIAMTDATLDFSRPEKSAFHASGASATMDTARQQVTVAGITTISSDDGLQGTLTDLNSDLNTNITIAKGPVDVTFADGTNLTAANMRYEGTSARWTFERATLLVPELPEGRLPAIPAFAMHGWVML
jgi:hypothetical protein